MGTVDVPWSEDLSTAPKDTIVWLGAFATQGEWVCWRARWVNKYGYASGSGYWQHRGGPHKVGLTPTHWAPVAGPPAAPEYTR